MINDWQLSGIFTGGSGAPYTVGYSYQGGIGAPILTGTPNYNARIIITGDPGKGCSSDLTRQFNTSAFSGPQPGSLGLESGLNYMRGCPDKTFDFAIARNINMGGNRQLQLRAELYNAFNAVIINGRNATMNIASLDTASAATNLPYDAAGQSDSGPGHPEHGGIRRRHDGAGSAAGAGADSVPVLDQLVRWSAGSQLVRCRSVRQSCELRHRVTRMRRALDADARAADRQRVA